MWLGFILTTKNDLNAILLNKQEAQYAQNQAMIWVYSAFTDSFEINTYAEEKKGHNSWPVEMSFSWWDKTLSMLTVT